MNTKQLNQLIADNYIIVNKHPSADLYIYNYSAKAQYDRVWNEITLACRGLILDGNYQVVARPFQKFFNLGEFANQEIPNEPFEVFEKMDGSLGILYWLADKPHIATRGSFASEQSEVATEMLHTQYAEVIPLLDKSKTYLFEIIYPENRIVLDYGNERKLVLLAIVDTQTSVEAPLENIGFETAKQYEGLNELSTLKHLEEDNKEGFVVKFKSGYRLKVKFEEYQRIHRIISQVSTLSIWKYLKTGQDLLPFLDRVPDEFYDWVKATHGKFLEQFAEIETKSKHEFKILEDRKATAMYFQTCQYPSVLFKMLDEQPYDQVIWKMLKPDFQKPFKGE